MRTLVAKENKLVRWTRYRQDSRADHQTPQGRCGRSDDIGHLRLECAGPERTCEIQLIWVYNTDTRKNALLVMHVLAQLTMGINTTLSDGERPYPWIPKDSNGRAPDWFTYFTSSGDWRNNKEAFVDEWKKTAHPVTRTSPDSYGACVCSATCDSFDQTFSSKYCQNPAENINVRRRSDEVRWKRRRWKRHDGRDTGGDANKQFRSIRVDSAHATNAHSGSW